MKKIEWAKAVKIILLVVASYWGMVLSFSVIEGVLVSKEVLGEHTAISALTVISIILAFVGSLVAAEKVGHGRMVISILNGACIVASTLVLSRIFFARLSICVDYRMAGVIGASCASGLVSGRKRERR